jgi:hypothetical protein
MSGTYNRTVIPGMSVGVATITCQAEIASILASSFWKVCSSENCGLYSTVIKDSTETFLVKLTPRVAEVYNNIQHGRKSCSIKRLQQHFP